MAAVAVVAWHIGVGASWRSDVLVAVACWVRRHRDAVAYWLRWRGWTWLRWRMESFFSAPRVNILHFLLLLLLLLLLRLLLKYELHTVNYSGTVVRVFLRTSTFYIYYDYYSTTTINTLFGHVV
ncbi:unnamed protein product [Laminaria digitata]